LIQLYWWERDSVYYVMRHAISGGHIQQVGQFYALDAAIELAMLVRQAVESDPRGPAASAGPPV
jgi:hypothetical protein